MTERQHLKVLHQSMQMVRDELVEQHMQTPTNKLTKRLLLIQADLDQLATQLEKTGTTKIFSKSS